jgi:hypothetical protein
LFHGRAPSGAEISLVIAGLIVFVLMSVVVVEKDVQSRPDYHPEQESFNENAPLHLSGYV